MTRTIMTVLVGLMSTAVPTKGCSDNEAWLDEKGNPCIHWVGRDCTRATSSGLTKAGQEDLIEQCPQTCGTDCVTSSIPGVWNPFAHQRYLAPIPYTWHHTSHAGPRPVVAALQKHKSRTGCSGDDIEERVNYTELRHIDPYTSCFVSTSGSELWACGLGAYEGIVTISRHSGPDCHVGARLDGSQKFDGTQLGQWRHSASLLGPIMCGECVPAGNANWMFAPVGGHALDPSVIPECIRNVCDRCDGPSPAVKCHTVGIVGFAVIVFVAIAAAFGVYWYKFVRRNAKAEDTAPLKAGDKNAENASISFEQNTTESGPSPVVPVAARKCQPAQQLKQYPPSKGPSTRPDTQVTTAIRPPSNKACKEPSQEPEAEIVDESPLMEPASE